MPIDTRHAPWRAEFETLGEEAVRMMDSGSQVVADDKIRFSRVWLAERAEAKRDAREEETLSIARDANRIAKRAVVIAIIAAIAATIAAIVEIVDKLFPKSF
jgi:hypothetical protein